MAKGLWNWLKRAERPAPPAPVARRLPDDLRVYAIGDVHGRHDLLEGLLDAIERDHAARPPAARQLIFLGDLINRGAGSREVIERLMALDPAETLFLTGNHEEVLCQLWRGDDDLASLFHRCEAKSTMVSYGVAPDEYDSWDYGQLAKAVRSHIPESHIAFLESFADRHMLGDYLFVHAGIRPGVPIGVQTSQDMRWIRSEFTGSDHDHGCIVVHGHTIVREPELRSNRIAVDTGAYRSGKLTAVGIEGSDSWFLTSAA